MDKCTAVVPEMQDLVADTSTLRYFLASLSLGTVCSCIIPQAHLLHNFNPFHIWYEFHDETLRFFHLLTVEIHLMKIQSFIMHGTFQL
jgi:hypothetical protein